MYLARHAAAVVDRAVPSPLWQLSAESRSAAAQLQLPAGAALTSSEEKARETARLAGLDATPDDRLREVVRPAPCSTASTGSAVTHGLAIALYADQTFAEWRAMPFPAVIEC
ncbi:MAG TPA: hypothetical protein VN615_08825 [Gaiellales bacterium]|nr:hypothetical protein [Gaiellales bacterium]